jgi:hypothetical protein
MTEKIVKIKDSSTPRFDEVNPMDIKWQHKVLYDLQDKEQFNYDLGTHTIILSGAVGSAKSLFAAHLTWRHMLLNPGAEVGLGRLDQKRLRDTSVALLLKHRPSKWEAGKQFKYNRSTNKFELPNGSVVYSMYWADKDFDRFKSREFSFFHLEEGTENDNSDCYKYISQRMGRFNHIEEKLIVLTTNPDEPEHWINQELMLRAGYINGVRQEGDPQYIDYTIHLYYSLTKDNPFLGKGYYENLLKKYNQKEVQRFLEGKWISLYGEGIYFAYNEEHYKKEEYNINLSYPIEVAFDFNTALGKPMSACFFQYINDTFYFFDEGILQGNTTLLMQEMLNRGLFDHNTKYRIHGDSSGYAKHASSNSYCDYDIIKRMLEQYHRKIDFKLVASRESNPGVKQRHNTVNAYLKNGLNQIRIYVYGKCKVLNEGFKLTRLLDRATYTEDDSKSYQHVTTAAGYGICECIKAPASITAIKQS